jgi:Outer membrane protein beta-barrel domain
MKGFAITIFASCLAAGVAVAQESPRVTFDFGAGFTTPVERSGQFLDTGWNVEGGVGANFTPWIGAKLQLGYNSMGINSTTLSGLGVPGGGVHIFSATVDPIIHLNPHGHVDFYVFGGGGVYHHNQDFTAPGIGTFTGCSPFYGCYPVAVPTTYLLASYSITKPGIEAGAGIAFGTRRRGKFFAEARWDRIFLTSGIHEDYLPVSFGFRY